MLLEVIPKLYLAFPEEGISYSAFKQVSSSKGRFQSKMLSDRPSSELSGDGSVLAVFPDNRRFQQFCCHLKEQEQCQKHFVSTSFMKTGG